MKNKAFWLVAICLAGFIAMGISGPGTEPEDHRTMIPMLDNSYDLGSSSRAFKDLYLEGNAYMGSGNLSVQTINYATCTDAGDLTFTITCDPEITLVTGTIIGFIATTPNTTGAFDIIYDSTEYSVKSLHNATPAANYVESGSYVLVGFDGTYFQLLTPDANP